MNTPIFRAAAALPEARPLAIHAPKKEHIMTTRIEPNSSYARIASASCVAVLSLALSAGMFLSPAARANAPSSTHAAAAQLQAQDAQRLAVRLGCTFGDCERDAPVNSGVAEPGHASEQEALPAPFMVAPCAQCMRNAPVGPGNAQPGHASEQKALPAPFLVAPGCGGGCRPQGGGGTHPTALGPTTEPNILPDPFLVAPNCPNCKPQDWGGTHPSALGTAVLPNMPPAAFLVAPHCPGGCGVRLSGPSPAIESNVLAALFLVAPPTYGSSGREWTVSSLLSILAVAA